MKVFLSLIAFFAFSNLLAATYYLSPNGNDLNSGAQSAPWKTLQKAFGSVKGHDVVYFLTGTYDGARAINLHPQAGQWITFKPYPGAQVRINTSKSALRLSGASYLIFDGFEITNLNYNFSLINNCDILNSQACRDKAKALGIGNRGILVDTTYFGNAKTDTHHIIIRNNNIHHNVTTAIDISTGGDPIKFPGSKGSYNIEIINNQIHHNGYAGFTPGYGTYITGTNFVVRGNHIYENSGNNLRIANTSKNNHAINWVIENNVIYNSRAPFYHFKTGTVFEFGWGAVLYGIEGGVFRNNLVYNNRGQGLWSVNVNVSNPTLIYNNTITGNAIQGAVLSGNTIARNNIVYGNAKVKSAYELTVNGTSLAEKNLLGGNPLLVTKQDSGIEQNNLKNLNPLFVSPSTQNFRIQSASPARNQGLTLTQVPKDIDGQSRPSGAYDIGADEFY